MRKGRDGLNRIAKNIYITDEVLQKVNEQGRKEVRKFSPMVSLILERYFDNMENRTQD